MNSKWYLGVVGVIAVLALVVGILRTNVREIIRDGKDIGAIPGREITENDFSIGGMLRYHYRVPFQVGTSTLCSFLSPNATTTLVYAAMQSTSELATSSPASGAAWVMATGASMGVTTTPFGAAQTISVKAPQQVYYGTTTGGAAKLSPRTWVSGRYTNPGVTEYSQVTDQRGSCEFEFVVN